MGADVIVSSDMDADRDRASWSDKTALYVGLGGFTENACVALCEGGEIIGICEQERITRVRGAGIGDNGLPDEALDELLRRSGRARGDVAGFALAEPFGTLDAKALRMEHHF